MGKEHSMSGRWVRAVTHGKQAALLAWIVVAGGTLLAQTAAKPAPVDPSTSAERGLSLVEQGRCKEALPILQRAMPRLTDKDLRYRTAMGLTRCAMAREETGTAVAALMQLRHDFPDDPEVMFVSVHYFSQLAMRTSQELAAKAPTSFQARRLEAEAFESQGKWDEAAGMYRGILRENPKEPGVHYRLGQVLISKAGESGPVDEAVVEFQKELEVEPHDAASEFVLGELARRAGNWDEAARRFSRASQADVEFTEAYVALGMSLNSAGKFPEAVVPLETYVKMQPGDPLGHYQLAVAYGRTGNREAAAREIALQKETAARQSPQAGVTEREVR
jgi:predicted Zn-dependent protease